MIIDPANFDKVDMIRCHRILVMIDSEGILRINNGEEAYNICVYVDM